MQPDESPLDAATELEERKICVAAFANTSPFFIHAEAIKENDYCSRKVTLCLVTAVATKRQPHMSRHTPIN